MDLCSCWGLRERCAKDGRAGPPPLPGQSALPCPNPAKFGAHRQADFKLTQQHADAIQVVRQKASTALTFAFDARRMLVESVEPKRIKRLGGDHPADAQDEQIFKSIAGDVSADPAGPWGNPFASSYAFLTDRPVGSVIIGPSPEQCLELWVQSSVKYNQFQLRHTFGSEFEVC